jgi:hypothetical protein
VPPAVLQSVVNILPVSDPKNEHDELGFADLTCDPVFASQVQIEVIEFLEVLLKSAVYIIAFFQLV